MTDRTLMGLRLDASYGLDISLPGFDVKTADDDELSFSTNWSTTGTIHQVGTLGRGDTASFPTLSYIPAAMVWRIDGSTIVGAQYHETAGWPTPSSGESPAYSIWEPVFSITDSDITLPEEVSSSDDYTAKYVIFRIPGNS